jgi:hypothetical protein
MSFGTLNLPMNLIQLLDRQVLNVLGVQLVVFTTTVNVGGDSVVVMAA